MGDLLGNIGEWIQRVIETLGYPGIVFVMALENVFPPIPSELVMPLAGFIAQQGRLNIFGVVIAGMVGSVVGALVLYYLGRWANETVIRRFIRRFGKFLFVSEQDLDRALNFFHRHGQAVIFFGRLIPIIRSLISVPAGMDNMPLPKFLFYTVLGTTIWSGFLSGAGWVLADQWERVGGVVEQYQNVVLVIVALALLFFLYRRVIKPRLGGGSAA